MLSPRPIFEQMTGLADPTRGRILVLLERQELTVSELCAVLQLPQSTVSRHLKILVDLGWAVSRRNGTRRLYSSRPDELPAEAQRLWELIREQVSPSEAAEQDGQRLHAVLARRRQKSRAFFSSTAGQWDRLRDELFGQALYPTALLGLLDHGWVLGDLGCGTGRVAESIAPFVQRVIAVDGSAEMVTAAQERLRGFSNVELRAGDLERLPVDDDALDAATLVLVLHHLSDPSTVLAEVARVLRPDGALLIVDMLPHDRHEYQQEMGHVWMGFSPERIERYARAAGFTSCRVTPLPADPGARGPLLFAATCKLRLRYENPPSKNSGEPERR